jgi:alcohol dehydrogenase (NADP+)
LETGYRLFDSAEVYGTEALLGSQLAALPPRNLAQIRVLSKLWNTNHRYEHAVEAFHASRKRLLPATLDTYLLHSVEAWRHLGSLDHLQGMVPEQLAMAAVPRSPGGEIDTRDVPLADTWGALKDLRQKGEVRAIGLCCSQAGDLLRLHRVSGEWPQVVQAPRDPRRPQEELVQLCREHGIELITYSCFGTPTLLNHPQILSLGEQHGRTPAQILLRWNLTQAAVALVASAQARHLRDNTAALEFELSAEDQEILCNLQPRD